METTTQTMREEHAMRLKAVLDQARKSFDKQAGDSRLGDEMRADNVYFARADLIEYVDAYQLNRADYGLKERC